MISPKDLEDLDMYKAEELIEKLDEALVSNHCSFPHEYESVSIDDEYPVGVRNEVARRYNKVGWSYVYHQTSSENNERPGFTKFIFSTTEVPYYVVKSYHKCLDKNDKEGV